MILAAVAVCAPHKLPAQTWTQASAPTTNWQAIAMSADGTRLIAAGGSYFGAANGLGPIFLSTNAGVSWTQSSAPITNWLNVCSSADGSKLAAGGARGIFYSTNSGIDWLKADAPFPFEYWSSVTAAADGSRLAAGEVGGTTSQPRGIYLSTNSGASWYPAGMNGSAVALAADGRKLVALQFNAFVAFVSLSTNFGATWKSNHVANAQTWWAVASSADGVKLAAAVGGFFINSTGSIYTSTNSGLTWTTNTPAGLPAARWAAIASSADGSKLVAAARDGGIYTSSDSGASWVSNSIPTADWRSVAISADGAKLAAAAFDGGIWTQQTTSSPSMNIKAATGNVVISWLKPSTDFVLQQNPSLTTTNWTEVTNAPVFNYTNLQHQVTLPISASNILYRLKTP